MDRAKAIKIAMIKQDISLTRLAKKLNVTPSAVHQVIHGNAKSHRIEKELQKIVREK